MKYDKKESKVVSLDGRDRVEYVRSARLDCLFEKLRVLGDLLDENADTLQQLSDQMDKFEADSSKVVKASAPLAAPINAKVSQVQKTELPQKKSALLPLPVLRIQLEAIEAIEAIETIEDIKENKVTKQEVHEPNVVKGSITHYVVAWNFAAAGLNYLAIKLNKFISVKNDNVRDRNMREAARVGKPSKDEQGISYTLAAEKYGKLKRSFKYSVFGVNIFKRISVWRLMRRAKKALHTLKVEEAYRHTDNTFFDTPVIDNKECHKKLQGYNARKLMNKLSKYQGKLSKNDKRDLTKKVTEDFKDSYFEKGKPVMKDILYYHAKVALFSEIAKGEQYSADTRGAASLLASNNFRKYNYRFENYQGTSEKLLATLGNNG